jgi:hypothetical protein
MLNPSQRTSLEVGMRLLEATIRDLLALVREPPREALLTRSHPIPEGKRAGVGRLLDGMLHEIALIVREFDLQPDDEEIGRRMGAEMSAACSELDNLLAGRLRRYGAVDPRLSARLDPHIQRLMRLSMEAARLLAGDRKGP